MFNSARPHCSRTALSVLLGVLLTSQAQAEPAARALQYKVGESEIVVNEYQKGGASKLVFFAPHDSERTCVAATLELIEQEGGRILQVKAGGERLASFRSQGKKIIFDPNRIFTETGIRKTMALYGSEPTPAAVEELGKFSRKLLDDLDVKGQPFVVAIHNNTDGKPLRISDYKKGSEIDDVFQNPALDVDDFFFVTTRAHFQALKDAGYNVALQNNGQAGDDGSLSVYCGQKGLKYINVEAELGHKSQQSQMLAAVSALRAGKPLPPPKK